MTSHARAAPVTGTSNSPPFFSVICATFNQAAFLDEALRSIDAQDYRDFEVVIVDDGSTDRTPEVLDGWWDRSSVPSNRRRRLRTANLGQSAAVERALGVCSGEYVALIDSDDSWTPAKLSRVRRVALLNPSAVMIAHPLRGVSANGKRPLCRVPSRPLTNGDVTARGPGNG